MNFPRACATRLTGHGRAWTWTLLRALGPAGLLHGAAERSQNGSCYEQLSRCVVEDFQSGVAGIPLNLRASEQATFQHCVLNQDARLEVCYKLFVAPTEK